MKKYLEYIISSLIGLGLAAWVIFGKGILSKTELSDIYHILCDGFFVPGMLLLGFGLLIVASNGGTFDMLVYGTKKFFNLFRKNNQNRLAETFYDYKKAKSESKLEFLFLIIPGLVYLVISMIFLMLYVNA